MKYFCVLFISLLVFSFSPADLPQVGKASYYSNYFHNRKTASGERYCKDSFTAAHRTLPFGTRVKVTNLDNGEDVVVRISDRGPYSKNRIIDLSYAAAKKIGLIKTGVAKVKIEPAENELIGPAGEVIAISEVHEPAAEDHSEIKTVDHLEAGNGTLIQAGAYKKPENLKKALDQLEALGFKAITVLQDVTYARIILGPYQKADETNSVLQKLQQQNIGAFVLKR